MSQFRSGIQQVERLDDSKVIINRPFVFLLYTPSHETVFHWIHTGGQTKVYDCETDDKYAPGSHSQWSTPGPKDTGRKVSTVFVPSEW